jgi:predicted acetyltransferase
MSTVVRIVDASEHSAWLDQLGLGFFEHQPEGASDYVLSISEPGRSRGAFDGDAVVGTLRSFATELTTPGPSSVTASALTAVTVAPTHRRRGLLTEMITGDLRDSAERGEVVSVLLASEFPIYGRFGYGAATEHAKYEISTVGLRFLARSEGTVELVDLRTLRRLAPPVFEQFRSAQPGSIGRDAAWWDRVLRQVEVPGIEPRKGFQAVYRSPGGDVEGYVLYGGKLEMSEFPPKGTLTVEELVAVSPGAYQALWEFCVNVDLQTTTIAPSRSVDEVLPLLVDDGRKVKLVARNDFLWVRVLDTRAALAGRRYLGEGRIVLRVIDEHLGAGGTYALDGSPEGATCTTTKARPDLTVPVAALGAAYLGGVAWSRLMAAGLVEEHQPGALALADLMFMTPRAPLCTTYF